jgi:hypothetical protein
LEIIETVPLGGQFKSVIIFLPLLITCVALSPFKTFVIRIEKKSKN